MADEPQPTQPQPAPPAPDPALEQLRSELAAEKAAREDALRRADASERKYTDDMNRVAQAWQAAQAERNTPPRDASLDDPDRIMSKRDMDAALKDATDRVVQTFSQTQVTAFDNIRQQNRERLFASGKHPLADKWRDEIESLATAAFNANPMEMAKPDAYEKLYKLVRGLRYEELRDHDIAQREAQRKAAADAGDDDAYDDGVPTAVESQPVARRIAPPAGDASGSLRTSANAMRRQPRVTLDNDFEKMQADRYFGGDAAAFKKAQAGDYADVDPFHMKGKDRY